MKSKFFSKNFTIKKYSYICSHPLFVRMSPGSASKIENCHFSNKLKLMLLKKKKP